jgi:serine protease AprX
VTLAWTDFPSTPAAMPHLNNDLDLIVTGPGGVFRGNVFSGGQSTTGGTADRRNTLEQVLLTTPAPGTYEVRVDDFNVPNGPQPLAIVVTGNVTEIVPPLSAGR